MYRNTSPKSKVNPNKITQQLTLVNELHEVLGNFG